MTGIKLEAKVNGIIIGGAGGKEPLSKPERMKLYQNILDLKAKADRKRSSSQTLKTNYDVYSY